MLGQKKLLFYLVAALGIIFLTIPVAPEEELEKFSREEIKENAGENPFMCALLVAETLPSIEWKTQIYSEIVDKYLEYLIPEEYELPLKVANSIEEIAGQAECLAKISSKYTQAEEEDLAEETLSRALEITQTIEEPYARGSVLVKVVDEFIEVEKYAQALELARSIESPYLKGKTLAAIAAKYTATDQKDKSTEILSEAFELPKSIEQSHKKVEVLDAIAYEFEQIPNHEQALEAVIISGKELGEIKSDASETEVYEKAEEMLADLLELMKTLSDVEDTLLEKGGEALDESEAPKTREEKLEEYEKDLAEARAMAHIDDKVKALVDVADKFLGEEQKEKGSQILNESFAASAGILSLYAKGDVLLSIVKQYLEIEEYPRAFEIVKSVELPYYKARALVEVGGAYGKAEIEPDAEAKKILQEIASGVSLKEKEEEK